VLNHKLKSEFPISLDEVVVDAAGSAAARHDCEIKASEALAFARRVAVVTTSSYSGFERRSEPRISTDDPASMQVLHPLLDGRSTIRVLDVSRKGLKLCCLTHMQRGTLVQVFMNNLVAMGEVRHCKQIGDEFHVGVQLDDVLPRHPDADSRNQVLVNEHN
jgi:hypothetical protein